jgi:hypothetical protein
MDRQRRLWWRMRRMTMRTTMMMTRMMMNSMVSYYDLKMSL